MNSSKLFLFAKEVHLNSGVRWLLELYLCTVCLSSSMSPSLHLGEITVAFTCTSLPLNLYTCGSGYGCSFGFEQKFWRIDGFGEKKSTDLADLHTPIHPPR